MALSDDELESLMSATYAEGSKCPCITGTTFLLDKGDQKDKVGTLNFFKKIHEANPVFWEFMVEKGKAFVGASSIQSAKMCIADLSSTAEFAKTKDPTLIKYSLKIGAVIYTLRSHDTKGLEKLVRNFIKSLYVEILMATVREFYPTDYQPLVEFINTMPSKPVAEEGGCAAASETAENPFDKTLLAIHGLPTSCRRESFRCLSGLSHADYNRGDVEGVLRFGTPEEAKKAHAIASEQSFFIEGVHPDVRLLSKEECDAYYEKFKALKLQRKAESRAHKH